MAEKKDNKKITSAPKKPVADRDELSAYVDENKRQSLSPSQTEHVLDLVCECLNK